MRYARMSDGAAIEIVQTDLPLTELFHPDLVATMAAASAEVEIGWHLVDGIWSPPPAPQIEEIRAARIEVLRLACAAAIVGGIVSQALGAPHTYPTDETAQRNLGGLVTRAILAPERWTCRFAAADVGGLWAYREHTALQIQAVGVAVADHIERTMVRFDTLRSAVEAALDAAGVGAIVWGE